MVKIKAFRGIRPEKSLASQIASLPYDVLNSEEARVEASENPYSFLHIDKAEIDLDPELSQYDPKVYQKAHDNLADFLEKQWLQKENKPALYLYELTMKGQSQLGLVTVTSVTDYLEGKIKKHELTRADKEIDRINHIEACNANTSPIFLTYRDNYEVKTITKNWVNTHDAEYDFTSYYDVTHKIWVIDDTHVIDQLTALFETNIPALYIADGHHRTESAVKVGQKRIQAEGNDTEAPYQNFLSVLFPKEELRIFDYNRVLNIPITEQHLADLNYYFDVTPKGTEAFYPQANHTFSMFFKGKWHDVSLKENFLEEETDTLSQLSAAIFQKYVAENIFGIEDIRTDKRIDFIGGIRGLNELESLVNQEKFTMAFALKEATMDDLLTVADNGQIMPPKSTWFEPKLRSGLFIHNLK